MIVLSNSGRRFVDTSVSSGMYTPGNLVLALGVGHDLLVLEHQTFFGRWISIDGGCEELIVSGGGAKA